MIKLAAFPSKCITWFVTNYYFNGMLSHLIEKVNVSSPFITLLLSLHSKLNGDYESQISAVSYLRTKKKVAMPCWNRILKAAKKLSLNYKRLQQWMQNKCWDSDRGLQEEKDIYKSCPAFHSLQTNSTPNGASETAFTGLCQRPLRSHCFSNSWFLLIWHWETTNTF